MSAECSALSPEQIRPALREEIDRLSDDNVIVFHRVAMQFEPDSLSDKLDYEFDQDRATGKLDRVPELIRTARDAIREKSA